jgi:hypothetical protein
MIDYSNPSYMRKGNSLRQGFISRNKIFSMKVFRSELSGWIAGMYWGIVIFLAILMTGIPLIEPLPYPGNAFFYGVFLIVFAVMAFTLYKAYRMKFEITKDSIIIYGVFRKNVIKRSEIKELKKVPIPYGFRLFGASFLGGWYYLPGIGKAWVAMGNFRDGVLITTKQNNYVITPKNPQDFIKKAKD